MLEVILRVNGRQIHRVTAVNRGQPSKPPGPEEDWRCYELNHETEEEQDFGWMIWHRRGDGAAKLAIEMLGADPGPRHTIPDDAAPPPTETKT